MPDALDRKYPNAGRDLGWFWVFPSHTLSTDPRAVAFVDGQNLYHAVRQAFGYTYPSYDVAALCAALCQTQGWSLAHVRFYTRVPDASDNPVWHAFWVAKLAQMGRQGVQVFPRPLRYRNKRVSFRTDPSIPTWPEREGGLMCASLWTSSGWTPRTSDETPRLASQRKVAFGCQ